MAEWRQRFAIASVWRDSVHATDLGMDRASTSHQEQGLGRLLRLRAAARAGNQTTRQVEAGGVSVESPFRQHTPVDLEQDHKMSDDILNRGEVVHRALAISYWAPTRNQIGKLWFLEHICP